MILDDLIPLPRIIVHKVLARFFIYDTLYIYIYLYFEAYYHFCGFREWNKRVDRYSSHAQKIYIQIYQYYYSLISDYDLENILKIWLNIEALQQTKTNNHEGLSCTKFISLLHVQPISLRTDDSLHCFNAVRQQ